MDQLAKRYECWLDKNEKILSFHYVADYLHKQFENYREFFSYVLYRSQNGFKIQ